MCDKNRVQLAGLSTSAYNGATAVRVSYNEKKQRYAVKVVVGGQDRTILVKPINVFVLK